nr:hypothetical protein [candidate division Zixibacteria bacterium]NIW78454.1 hypothetical protein [Calditrichia bacterium]
PLKLEAAENTREVPQPIQEVFQSDLVYPQEEDEIQFTFFPSFRQGESAKAARTLVEIEYGITDAFQLIFEWEGLLYKEPDNGPAVSGPGNLELGGQYSWMALGDGNTHFAFGTLVEFPTGPVDNGLTDGFLEWKQFVILARDFPRWNQSQLFVELGFNWVDRIRTPSQGAARKAHDLFWNVGGFLPIGPWRLTLEINGSNNQWNGGNNNDVFLTPGVIYKLSKAWEAGVAVPVGLTPSSDSYRIVGYLMWEFELNE